MPFFGPVLLYQYLFFFFIPLGLFPSFLLLMLFYHDLLDYPCNAKALQTKVFISNGLGQSLLFTLVDGVHIHFWSLLQGLF